MSDKKDNSAQNHSDDWEPDWLNPENDRKTPYTEDELKEFAEGFIESMRDTSAVKNLVNNVGRDGAKEIVKERFKKKDEYNLDNLSTNGTKH